MLLIYLGECTSIFFYSRRDSRSPDEKSRSPSREKNGDASPQSGDD